MKRKKILDKIILSMMAMVSVMFLLPIYFILINTFKPLKNILLKTASFPESLYFQNYIDVWRLTQFGTLLRNSVIITGVSLVGIVLFGSMAGYKISRMRGRYGYILVMYFILTLIIPFQAVMIPLVKVMNGLNLIDSIHGIILVYIGLGTPMGVFLYHGAAKTIPVSIEEAALIDGAGAFTSFFKVIFPLLQPITSTLIILEGLWIWNDYLLPLITLQSNGNKTIPLGTTAAFFGKYMSKWNYGITAITIASLPMLILYIFMQKFIIKGIISGSVK
jgi:raffinose/stachyose/melibiose transport system permease protein